MLITALTLLLARPAGAVEARVLETRAVTPLVDVAAPLRLADPQAPNLTLAAPLAEPPALETPLATVNDETAKTIQPAALIAAPQRQEQQAQKSDDVQAQELDARFDGVKLKETPALVTHVDGGRVENTFVHTQGGTQLCLSRRLIKGRYEAAEHNDAGQRFSVSFQFDKGVLRTRFQGRTPEALDAKAEFKKALDRFETGVQAVEGSWTGEELARINRLTKKGLSAEDAVLKTWTGRQAAKHGFTKVVFPPEARQNLKTQPKGEYAALNAYFIKPEAARVDRDGGVWRRARIKAYKNDLWARYEKDGKSVSLLRRRSENESAVYEFSGEEKPKDGTPSNAMALFTLKDGVLLSHVESGKSTLLSAKEEFRAAVELWKDKLTGIKGIWVFGDNLAEFNKLTAAGLSPEQAARKTWTGKRAAEAGFTRVVFGAETLKKLASQKPGAYDGVAALFVKP